MPSPCPDVLDVERCDRAMLVLGGSCRVTMRGGPSFGMRVRAISGVTNMERVLDNRPYEKRGLGRQWTVPAFARMPKMHSGRSGASEGYVREPVTFVVGAIGKNLLDAVEPGPIGSVEFPA